jgi:hypothetical protein
VTTGRRGLTVAVLACCVAGAVAFLSASRGWGTVTIVRPAPLPPTVTARTGDAWVPALPALSLVAIAGAGALLALKGVLRKVIGLLLTATGLGCVAAAVTGLAEGADPLWPVLAVVGGLVIAATGAVTVKAAGTWPSMGARYERPAPGDRHERPARKHAPEQDDQDAPEQNGNHVPEQENPDRTSSLPAAESRAELWDALDRGEDPTS